MVKKDRAKKLKKPPVKKLRKRMTGLVILDGKRQIDRRTGLNRDIPAMTLGGAGGSPNLLQALASRPAITGQGGGTTIQTPDQFKLAQDITRIKAGQEDIKAGQETIIEQEKKRRADFGLTREENRERKMKLEDVAKQKKSFVEPEKAPVEVFVPQKEAPMKTQKEQPQRAQTGMEGKIRKKLVIQEEEPAQSAGGAPRQWLGGGEVGGLAPASAPSSIVGDADATGAPQPDTY